MANRGSDAELPEEDAAALAFAEALTLDAHSVQEDTWTRLRACFYEGEIVEMAAVASLFNAFNRFNDALEVEVTR